MNISVNNLLTTFQYSFVHIHSFVSQPFLHFGISLREAVFGHAVGNDKRNGRAGGLIIGIENFQEMLLAGLVAAEENIR